MILKGITVSEQAIDVGSVVDGMRNPEAFFLTEKVSIYTINDVAVTFNIENGHVLMRLVGKSA